MRSFVALSFIAFFAGCVPQRPSLYYWGHYEDLLYTSYAKPGSMAPEDQIGQLEEDYQKARSANQAMPPGWHANLGYLYFQAGKLDQARQEFLTEKASFPESGPFMDRLLAKLKRS